MTFKTKSDAFDLAVAELRASSLFRQWKRRAIERSNLTKDGAPVSVATEKHYSPAEIAKMWGVSVDTVRQVFRERTGVLKIGENSTRYKRGYQTLRIPESLMVEVYAELSK